jgi:hypothetical protein
MKIDFEFDTTHGLFRDALHVPDDHAFTDLEIETMKQQRVNDWIAMITTVPIEVEAVVEIPVEINTEE